jgi:DNA mismatch endonuclease, patch repair protein
MADTAVPSSPEASARMRSNRARDTGPERAVRSGLHRKGLRFRVHQPVIPGSRRRTDIVFPSVRVAVFIDGCFWHGCPVHGTMPKSNREFWEGKFQVNRERDRDTDHLLRDLGWTVLRFWEHAGVEEVVSEIEAVVKSKAALGAPLDSPTG